MRRNLQREISRPVLLRREYDLINAALASKPEHWFLGPHCLLIKSTISQDTTRSARLADPLIGHMKASGDSPL